MFKILRGNPETSRRRWRPIVAGGKASALISCPDCGRKFCLGTVIEETGEIRTELSCPDSDCNFRQHTQLVGWEKMLRRLR